MVGVVILKNFETGSYKYMQVTVFDGSSYADIERGEAVFSYSVNPDEDDVRQTFSLENPDISVSKSDILAIASFARTYMFQNPYATILKFKKNGSDTVFKTSSCREGVSSPASFHSLFLDDSLYMLLSDEKENTYTWRSAFCDALNFAMQKIFGISDEIYSQSAGGIYINIALIGALRSKFIIKDLPWDVFVRLLFLKGGKKRRLKPVNLCKEAKPCAKPVGSHAYAVYLYRKLKYAIYQEVSQIMSDIKNSCEAAVQLALIVKNSSLRLIVDEFCEDMSDFANSYYDFGYVSSKTHINMMSVREILSLANDTNLMENISKVLSARSSNIRFFNKLPCAKYILSDGTAIW